MAKRRKNNDGISFSGFQQDWRLFQGMREISLQHRTNWAEVEMIREYLKQHPAQEYKLRTGKVPITQKSADKILRGIKARARKKNTSD